MNSELRIGEVARRTGVSTDTLRYYERLRLLPRSRRSSGGFRLFTAEHIARVRFIKQAQELGFSLEEIFSLAAAFYFTYRPQKDCGPGEVCVAPKSRRFHVVILWSVTTLVGLLLIFPYLVPFLPL